MKLNDIRCLRRELEEYRALLDCLPPAGSWRSAALEHRLQRTADRLAEELWGISKFITEISDPELRLLFELRYFRGYTWREVAERLPTRLSADGARMKHDRYMKARTSAPHVRRSSEETHYSLNKKEGSVG